MQAQRHSFFSRRLSCKRRETVDGTPRSLVSLWLRGGVFVAFMVKVYVNDNLGRFYLYVLIQSHRHIFNMVAIRRYWPYNMSMMKKCIFVLAALLPLLFVSCGGGNNVVDGDNPHYGDDSDELNGKEGNQINGKVTFYEGYDEDGVAYYAPEIESGWYKCAVSENKLDEFPPQSAAEITYNGKTIRVLVTDLCPNAGNSEWTSQSDYYFDLGKNAFAALGDTVDGVLDVSIKKIAYQTSKNIKFQVKDGVNQWWLAGRFYNMRYPLKKVEYSNGGDFKEMKRLSGKDNNWWVVEGSNLMSNVTFRLTDVYGDTETTSRIGSLGENGKYDTGINFTY